DDGVNGTELWKSDGTAAGTVLVKDINPGSTGGVPNSSNPTNLVTIGGTVYFAADDGADGQELWKRNGTAAGTTLVNDINPGVHTSVPNNFTPVGGTLFFTASDATNGNELWMSDGTGPGTVPVKAINPGPTGSLLSGLTLIGTTLFFSADDGTNGSELWK